jgi:hypothetical protein
MPSTKRMVSTFAGKDTEIERLRARSAKFEQLLSEALRQGWLDESKTSPSWLRRIKNRVEIQVTLRLVGWYRRDRYLRRLTLPSGRLT